GAAQASPHSLLQVYLNRQDDYLWGFLSNGRQLRVLRDNVSLTRQAYVEFDLEAMMTGEIYSDFVLLWLLCHQSRVEAERPSDFWLEQWVNTAQQQGTRALEHLRVGVQESIERLGEGFIAHPANGDLRDRLQQGSLDQQDYYRQLLRVVYRLLFLFAAEDRDLLFHPDADEATRDRYVYYSTQRLRELSERLRGTRHHDLFEGLRLVMGLLGGEENGGGAMLGLPVLGSFLFSHEAVADIIDCRIANRDLLAAVRALAYVEDKAVRALRPVDYKNLGPEELGSVYESLLELHPAINLDARTFSLGTASGHERKTTGSYYTPSSLINALLDSALDPVLEEAAKGGEAALLDLKICDPACGSGHFLIAAAHRLARRVAAVRTGEDEPAPDATRAALRDVIGGCIYGVDINPMAVELCKVNLWMEALEPGKPLSFLDHRILCGNSLLGTTPRLMADGIPDDAFKPIEGDDKKVVSALRKQNRQERKDRETGQMSMFQFIDPPADYASLRSDINTLDALDDATLDGIRAKEERYRQLANDPEYIKARLLADAWCAVFVWEKKADAMPPLTDLFYRRLKDAPLAENMTDVRQQVARLTDRYQFFHWHVAFPDVFSVPDDLTTAENEQMGWGGGFDCVLGNPPWDQIQLDDREFFAASAPEIAGAANMTARKRMIKKLADADQRLYAEYQAAVRANDGVKHFAHASGRYPYTSFGRLNTAPLFCEAGLNIINRYGYSALIVPTGIATDSFNQYFFNHIVDSMALSNLYDFENSKGIFPAVHRSYKFCLLTLNGAARSTSDIRFVFFAYDPSELAEKSFTLSPDDIAMLNPNTRTTPVFRTRRDADLTKSVYQQIPILIREGEPDENPWGVKFQLMFMMNTDSDKFRTWDEMETQGSTLEGNHFVRGEEVYLPLYEAKMMHQFTHRWATYEIDGRTRDMTLDEMVAPDRLPLPRYWISDKAVNERIGATPYMIGFRDITNTTNERTAIMGMIPFSGVGHTMPIMILSRRIGQAFPLVLSENERKLQFDAGMVANVSSYVFDFIARQKLGGTHLTFFIAKQLPFLPPRFYVNTPFLLDFITVRVLELTYTAWDLQAFAQDVGWDGPPFVWDEERRFLMRCELDALYFHLYQIGRDDVDYIMETFPIVKRKDIKATTVTDEAGEVITEGTFRTKETILAMYDQMAALPTINVPAPKDPSQPYAVPDVSQFQTWLSPPPADSSVAHPEREG
ncbi:Eco57I restriction-modification methylase domain-containing protein, partial [Chloroflexota bacterium]